jgi:hypothetical protein
MKRALLLNKGSCQMYRKPTHDQTFQIASLKEDVVANQSGNGKRELIDTGTDKRYVRRNVEGQFRESDDQGRSLAQDVKQKAKTKVKSGQGDRGDLKRS